MASFVPEATPDSGDFDDIEAHLGRRPLRVLVNGEYHIIQHPGNFPALFAAYQLNRDGESTTELAIDRFQEHLRSDPNGIAATSALNKLTANEDNQELIWKAIGHSEGQVRAFYYAQMIDETVQFLPPGLDAGVLRDPYNYEDAA